MQNKIDAILNAIENLGNEDVIFYGIYHGRCFFTGVAVRYATEDDICDLKQILTEDGHGDLASARMHRDSLGRGYIAAWDESLFTDEELDQAKDINQY